MADDTTSAPQGDPATYDPYPIQVRGPDGVLHPFREGTTVEEIRAALGSRYAPQGIAQPGAATPQAGAVQPFNQSVPSYMDPEDWRNLQLTMMFGEKNRGIAQMLQSTPGKAYRTELAKKTADEVQRRQDAQFAGTQILKSYAVLLDRFNNTPDEDLLGAIGPRNQKPYQSWLPFVGGMTEPEAAASYSLMPNLTGGKTAQGAQNTKTLLTHDINGLVNALVSNGKNLNMSDERQKLFGSAAQDFLHATNRESAAAVLADLKHIISNDFNIPMGTANALVGQYLKDLQKEKFLASNSGAGASAQPHTERVRNTQTGQMETLQWDGRAWKRVQ